MKKNFTKLFNTKAVKATLVIGMVLGITINGSAQTEKPKGLLAQSPVSKLKAERAALRESSRTAIEKKI